MGRKPELELLELLGLGDWETTAMRSVRNVMVGMPEIIKALDPYWALELHIVMTRLLQGFSWPYKGTAEKCKQAFIAMGECICASARDRTKKTGGARGATGGKVKISGEAIALFKELDELIGELSVKAETI